MATQPTTDAPFGLQPNIAAGLAYTFTWLGGLIMLFGGGTNKMVKWAAAQSIVLWVGLFLVNILITILSIATHGLLGLLGLLVFLVMVVAWFYTVIMGFQGKDIRLPVVADLASKIFASQLA